MKIAIVTDHFLPKIDGIVTRLCAALSYFISSGHELCIFTVEKPKESPFPGATIHHYPGIRLPYCASRKVSSPHFFSVLKNLKRYKPDVLHVINATLLALPAYYYAKNESCPVIGSVHTDYLIYSEYYKMKMLKPFIRSMLRLFCRLNEITLCPSENFEMKLKALGAKRTGIWQKGVDTKRFHPKNYSSAMRYYLSQGHPDLPLIIYAGRLSAEKNLLSLHHLIKSLPNARLALIGDGPLRKQLTQQFAGYPIFFAGHLQGEALASAYASADIFVMPSVSETLGLVVLEAMASGCPVIAANAGGLQEILHHSKDGFLFNIQEENALLETVRCLMNDNMLRQQISAAARKESEKWDWLHSSIRLLNCYKSVIKHEEG